MRRLRHSLHRPLADQPRWVPAALTALALITALAVALTAHSDHSRQNARRPAAPAPSPVLNPPRAPNASPAPGPAISPEELARARHVSRTFLTSYLPVLYGHAKPTTLIDTTPAVRRGLTASRRVPKAVRDRRPRLTALAAQPQTNTSVLMTATVNDGVIAPFRLIFLIQRQPDGRWLITNLAND